MRDADVIKVAAQLQPRVSRQSEGGEVQPAGSEIGLQIKTSTIKIKSGREMATFVKSLAMLVICQSVTLVSGFEFDHAFRKISMEDSPELSSMDNLMKRIGLAMGEEEEVEEPLEEHKLLRRVGLGPEDQDAVESMLKTEVSL